MTKIATIILTFQEEPRIEECLKIIRPYTDFLLVVDGNSVDNTVKMAEKYADLVVTEPSELKGDMAAIKNHARTLVPKDHLWVQWVDADERWDLGFLVNMHTLVEDAEKMGHVCFRFPRVNLPDGKNFPDMQVRLFRNSQDIEWRGKTHETPYYKLEGIPLDQVDREDREVGAGVVTAHEYPILHLPRRTDEKRSWW